MDKSRCKATPLTIPPPSPRGSSVTTSSERHPRQVKTPNNLYDGAMERGIKSGSSKDRKNCSISKDVYAMMSPANDVNREHHSPLSLSPKSDTNAFRSPSLSPTPGSRGGSLSPLSPRKLGQDLSSSAPSMSGTSSRNPSLSPMKTRSNQEPSSFPQQERGKTGQRSSRSPSPNIRLSPISGKREHKDGHTFDQVSHDSIDKQAPPLRDIFSPVPSEHHTGSGLGHTTDSRAHGRLRVEDYDNDSCSTDNTGSIFPAITVETCDDDNIQPAGLQDMTKDSTRVKKSMSIPNSLVGRTWKTEEEVNGNSMVSLNVPSAFFERRTTDGRLIVGMNDTLPTFGSLTKTWSRSEGNIPLAVKSHHVLDDDSDDDDQAHHDKTADNLSRSSSPKNHSRTTQLSRQNKLLNTAQVSKEPSYFIHSSHKQNLLQPSLREELVSRPSYRLSPEPSVEEIRRSIKFLSPQIRRRFGPRN